MSSTRCRGMARRARRDTTLAIRVRRVVEQVCNNGDLAVLDDVLPMPSSGPSVPAALREALAAFRAAVPDARWTIVEQISQGGRVVTRLEVQGTFSGPLLGLAAPGRPATLTGVAISRFAGGRLAELWLHADLLGLLVQLEVLPPLGLAEALTMARVARAGAAARWMCGAETLPPHGSRDKTGGRPG